MEISKFQIIFATPRYLFFISFFFWGGGTIELSVVNSTRNTCIRYQFQKLMFFVQPYWPTSGSSLAEPVDEVV